MQDLSSIMAQQLPDMVATLRRVIDFLERDTIGEVRDIAIQNTADNLERNFAVLRELFGIRSEAERTAAESLRKIEENTRDQSDPTIG